MTDLLIQPDAMVAPAWPPAEALALDNGYEPDPFQKHAILGIHAGDHVFVTAKTGSGKTFVGEYLIARALAAGKRIFYTTPIKSLSNQKYHDLKVLFPQATVGLLTGDIKMQPDAQIVVMTAEILRNLFYKRGTVTECVGLTAAVNLEGVVGVVMDEVHYIQDPDRGHVWEESLILCPQSLQLVLLSATMPSAASLAGWLAKLHQRRTWLLSTTYRVVPLTQGILLQSTASSPVTDRYKLVVTLDSKGVWNPDGYQSWLKHRKDVEDGARAHQKAVAARQVGDAVPKTKVRPEDPVHRLRRTVSWLEATANLPALFFVFSRKECERLASLVEGSLIDSSDAAAATHIIDFHLSRHRAVLEQSPVYHKVRDLLIRGIAFHHSGLLPLLKEIVELLFARGFIKVLFATETFSVGLNMPTKTVVFLELRKFSDDGMRLLRPDEYIQMAGRAGRRGKDTQGLVLYEPLREPVDAAELKGLLTGKLAPLQSQMRFHYDFILCSRLTGFSQAEQSYWALQQKEIRAARGLELGVFDARIAALEQQITPAHRALLAERDELESVVARSVNAPRKKAQLALNRWLAEHDDKRFVALTPVFKSWQQLIQERDALAQELRAWDVAPLLALEPLEACLTYWGFLDGGITCLGQQATEVNEGHLILMPLLAVSGICDAMTADEIVCVLAAFLNEGSSETDIFEEPHDWLIATAKRLQQNEDSRGVYAPTGFWSLSSLWPAVVRRWLAGEGLTQIATVFGLFEGNIQRGLMRLSNIVDEWRAIATLRRDLAMLEKFAEFHLLRNEIIVDSLYLRL